MKGDTYKYQLILSILRTRDSNQIQIENSLTEGSLCEKLLRVKFDPPLTFDHQVKSLCQKSKCKTKSVLQGCSLYGISKKEINNECIFSCTNELLPAIIDYSYPF